MNDLALLAILIIHYIGDFVFQTDAQAKNKSTSNKYLLYHVVTYSVVWLLSTIAILEWKALIFFLITFIAHFSTDYITSRISKKYFSEGNTHAGFIVIGADQILHYIQLYLTFKILLEY